MIAPRSPSGTRIPTTMPRAVAVPKRRAPPNALIGAHRHGEPRVHEAEQDPDDDRDDHPERERDAATERLMQHEAGEIPEESREQHDALDPDVHHAGALVEHAAQRPEGKWRRE